MAALNETKERMAVVKSVGGFANALQQIAAMRMVTLREKVVSSKRFVDEASEILQELSYYKQLVHEREYVKANRLALQHKKYTPPPVRNVAVIIVSSNQGLCGRFNAEIFKKVEQQIIPTYREADFFLIGKKGQEHYMTNKKYQCKFFPYDLPDNFESQDLLQLVEVFPYYQKIVMVYSRFVNTINRDVVDTLLVSPPAPDVIVNTKEPVRFLFEPSIEELIKDVSNKLRAATFQQQILDSRLAQFSAQMVGMQAASENAKTLTTELQHEYNKIRRKMIDKKIAEVLGGSALW